MPSKVANLIVFLVVAALSLGLHYVVYRSFCSYLRTVFPKRSSLFQRIALALFVTMELPFLYLFLLHRIKSDVNELTRIILIPFTVWQFLLFVWGIVLVMKWVLWRGFRVGRRASQRVIRRVRPIIAAVGQTRGDISDLDQSEELLLDDDCR